MIFVMVIKAKMQKKRFWSGVQGLLKGKQTMMAFYFYSKYFVDLNSLEIKDTLNSYICWRLVSKLNSLSLRRIKEI